MGKQLLHPREGVSQGCVVYGQFALAHGERNRPFLRNGDQRTQRRLLLVDRFGLMDQQPNEARKVTREGY